MAASDFVGHGRQARIDHQHAVLADLHGDVAARADDHVDVALHGPDMDFSVLILRADQAGGREQKCEKSSDLHFASAFVAGAAPRILS